MDALIFVASKLNVRKSSLKGRQIRRKADKRVHDTIGFILRTIRSREI